jgi:phosphoesterase RecJ-like protein
MTEEHKHLINKLNEELSTPKQIVITTHQGPDGDAIGSSMGLYLFLKKQGHNVNIITPNDYPAFLHWVTTNSQVVNYMRDKTKAEELLNEAEYIFMMDFNAFSRTADMSRTLYKRNAIRVLIDHHPNPEISAKYILSVTDVSSTCELLYCVLKCWNAELIDTDIARCLYTGIMTDTGCFCYRSANAQTFEIAAELINYGVDREDVYNKVYNDYSENRMRLMGYCLNEKMEVIPQYNTAIISLNLEEQIRYEFIIGDSEGFVNLPLSLKGIRFVAFFLEKEDKVKISFRSKSDFSVNDFARKHYGGGGHKNAAGADSKKEMTTLIEQFKQILPDYEKELSQ